MKSFKEYRFDKNPLERKIVEDFCKQYSDNNNIDLIVFGHHSSGIVPKEYLTDREKQIVLSTIQWIASPVGESFVLGILNTNDLDLNPPQNETH